jgi:hypothetical protein
MASKSTSHRILLDKIKKTRARDEIIAKNDNPRLACRREFRREMTNQRVTFWLHDPVGGRVAWGTAVLVDYSPNGAQLGHIMFEDGFWPDGDFSISFQITGGPYEGAPTKASTPTARPCASPQAARILRCASTACT